MNPVIQSMLIFSGICGTGLALALRVGKFLANSSDKPLFNDTRNSTIFSKPSIVKCCFRFINSTIFLNITKSPHF
jgi:hypothetical protein